MTGPRDHHPSASDGAYSWASRVQSGEVTPNTVAEAIAFAFTRCLADYFEAEHGRRAWTDESDGGHLKVLYRHFAPRLGMGIERFRSTYQGARWLRLPELQAVLDDPELGVHCRWCLQHYLEGPGGVLQQDRKPERRVRSGQVGAHHERDRRPTTPSGGPGRMDPDADGLRRLASRVQHDLAQLDRLTEHFRQLGHDVSDQPDWRALRVQAGVPRSVPSGAPPGRIRAVGAGSLADLVRDVLRPGKPMRSYQIKLAVNRAVFERQDARGLTREPLTGDQIDACLARLKRAGEVVSPQRGQYVATSELRERTV